MKILIVGSGGREHAIAWKLSQSRHHPEILIAPGNAGTASIGRNLPIAALSPDAVTAVAREHAVDLVIIGPELPLVEGVADTLRENGFLVLAPSAAAARIEGSKIFSKRLMEKTGIPTARFSVAETAVEALRVLEDFPVPVVLKADGLAAGKGVVIAHTLEEARTAVLDLMEAKALGDAGTRVVIEEFLVGEEVSFIILTDGVTVIPFPPAQDHKAIFDDDRGPNTGGMGAYSDSRILSPAMQAQILRDVVEPTLRGMEADGAPFTGFLFVGLMITADGPRVLEFNARLGDPEAQVLLMALDSDLVDLCLAAARRQLADVEVSWKSGPTVCIVHAAANYPGRPLVGQRIEGIREAESEGAIVFHAGTGVSGSDIVSTGGRVLGVTASGESLPQAIEAAYRASAHIHFEGMQRRSDIGTKGLKRW
ncbi:MAG: phosphoribosylamine--glycine ligase [Bryobacterales bacterium]|nr:phosphoribosylamine--glycine ligase [Bryobacterales bacterium]